MFVATPPPSTSSMPLQRRHATTRRPVNVVLVISAALVLSGILLYIWPHIRFVELGYKQSTLQTQRAQVLQLQKELQIELSTLRQLSRIEGIAVQRLGLYPPQTSQVIYVRPGEHTISPRRER